MKLWTAFLLFLLNFSSAPDFAQTWRTDEILLDQEISDGLIEDLNGDGRKDLLFIAGNFVYLFFQKDNGFSQNPDESISFKLLGEYIDAAEVDPLSPGLELLGLSEKGVKCFRKEGSRYVEPSDYLISIKVDMPEYRLGPAVSDFAFDVNADGRDEIFLLQENKVFLYRLDDSGQWNSVAVEDTEKLTSASLKSRIQTEVGLPPGRHKNVFFFFRPSVLEENAVLFQDFNGDNRLDLDNTTMRLQESAFRFSSVDYPLLDKAAFADRERYRFYLDIDGDGELDLVFLEAKDILTENINIFPFAKIYIHRQKNGGFAPTPDFFQKTILVNDQPPFVDVDGDGDLDFISIWSEITPGSKQDILQVLLESTWNFTFRCYLFDKEKGYSLTPDINLKTKIKQELSRLVRDIPFDISGDFDCNGCHDLIIIKDPGLLTLYFFDLKAKKYIASVKRLNLPAGFSGYQVADLDGDGRSDLLLFTGKGARICFSTAE